MAIEAIGGFSVAGSGVLKKRGVKNAKLWNPDVVGMTILIHYCPVIS